MNKITYENTTDPDAGMWVEHSGVMMETKIVHHDRGGDSSEMIIELEGNIPVEAYTTSLDKAKIIIKGSLEIKDFIEAFTIFIEQKNEKEIFE